MAKAQVQANSSEARNQLLRQSDRRQYQFDEVVSVVDYGADPTGATDSTAAIQEAIDAANSGGGTLHFPAGLYSINATLNLGGFDIGLKVTSDGAPECYYRDGSNYHGAALVWAGGAAPMILYQGIGLDWDGPALWGNQNASPTPVPTAGFEITKNSSIGTGQNRWRQLHVGGCTIALHANDATNVDNFQIDRMWLRHCTQGFRTESSQNVGNTFGFCICRDVATIFDFGFLSQTHVEFLKCLSNCGTVVRAEATSAAAGGFYCDGLKVDDYNTLVYVDTTAATQTHARFTFNNATGGGNRGTGNAGGLVKIRGENVVTFRGGQQLSEEEMLEHTAGDATRCGNLIFENCRIARNASQIIHTGGTYTSVRFIECQNADGFPLGQGITANRPTVGTEDIGRQFYDETLQLPIWFNGSVWMDAAGNVV